MECFDMCVTACMQAFRLEFLISQHKHMLWALERTISMRWFLWVPKTYYLIWRFRFTLKSLILWSGVFGKSSHKDLISMITTCLNLSENILIFLRVIVFCNRQNCCLFVCLRFYVPVNSYYHIERMTNLLITKHFVLCVLPKKTRVDFSF